MAAIPSNTNNYYCSTNATAARSNIASMDGYFSSLDINDGVVQLYQLLQKTDDITINCGNAIMNAALPDLFLVDSTGTNSYFGESFIQNILYNVGFQFTDVLDLIFIDPSNTDPFWYYVSFRVGDFFIRFVYRDTTP